MSSKSLLLFSSDQETSQQMTQALAELDFQVESCPEIFVAVEKLTSRSFDVIVTDWDDGIEADFLLKTARELKSNRTAFTIAIAKTDAAPTARQAGADMVLSKPVLPGQVSHALLTSEEFAARMAAPKPEEQTAPLPTVSVAPARVTLEPKRQSPGFLPTSPLPPSPVPSSEGEDAVLPISSPVNQAYTPAPSERTGYSRIQTLFSSTPNTPQRPSKPRSPRLFSIAIFGLILVPLSALFYSPVTRAAVTASAGRTYERIVVWMATPSAPEAKPGSTKPTWAMVPMDPSLSLLPQRSRTIHVPRQGAGSISAGVVASVSDENNRQLVSSPDTRDSSTLADEFGVPPSLSLPPASVPIHDSGLRPSPSVLAAIIEPIELPEVQSQKLVVQKVQPAYPDQALRSGLQGPVVFRVSVAKDGSVRDLKLVQGSFLLGQAAFPAVKQWRYKPYFINGHAVETMTQVTVEFKLPAVAQAAPPER